VQGTLVYDGYERPDAIAENPGSQYGYNAFNERTYKDIQGQVTGFVYGPGGELLGEKAAGGPEQDYVYLDGRLLARLDSTAGGAPTVYYFHTDALGTPQAMTDANQQIVWQARYTPFGTATVTQQTLVNNLRYPGQYFDQETLANYNLHRFYDPNTGRYISADPTGLAAGTNLYNYVGGNPISNTDPEGLFGYSYGTSVSWSGILGYGITGGTNGQFFSDGSSAEYGVVGTGWGASIGGDAQVNGALNFSSGSGGAASWAGPFESIGISAFGGSISFFWGGGWYGFSAGGADGGGAAVTKTTYVPIPGTINPSQPEPPPATCN
jgi:RHS repeat-associated protein